MRNFALLPLLTAPAAFATPALLQDAVSGLTGYTDLSSSVLGSLAKGVEHLLHGADTSVEKKEDQWTGHIQSKPVVANGLDCEFALLVITACTRAEQDSR